MKMLKFSFAWEPLWILFLGFAPGALGLLIFGVLYFVLKVLR